MSYHREALVLPEVVARKGLVKNAMQDGDDMTTELMPTIKVQKLSSLAHKLPKPAYPELQVPLSPETG